jgi:transcription factor SPT20
VALLTAAVVRTTAHILKKFSKSPPSFSLHLYPTNFKIEGQDGGFGYNSPMKALLEHIKAQTIPHDMMEEFRNAGFRLYDGKLGS